MYGAYKIARKSFGTWNKAVQAAGFKPNPVKFAKIHIANDGHRCDSLAERVIDDWFTAQNIKHDRNIVYPNSRYTVDFLVNGKFVEFLGLQGELEKYDHNVRAKEEIALKNNIELIKIFPKDLFPKNNLSNVLKQL